MPGKDTGKIIFNDEITDSNQAISNSSSYKILIVDDDISVHKMTTLVLGDFSFEGQTCTFINAYTGQEAQKIMKEQPDIALILLDIVMETDQAGLDVVKYIRRELKNNMVRIILRTGQPGQAPEKQVIVDYDINDYREKIELTAQKLYTVITTALRSYRDLRELDESKKGLIRMLDATGNLFKQQSLINLSANIRQQLENMFYSDNGSFNNISSFTASSRGNDLIILSATGKFSNLIGITVDVMSNRSIKDKIYTALNKKKNIYSDDYFIGYFQSSTGHQNITYIDGFQGIRTILKNQIEIFSQNIVLAYENLYLNDEIIETQKSIVFTLGDLIEKRSLESGVHVQRMSNLTCFIAQEYGLSTIETNNLKIAAPMHDIGKVAIPDSILQKPGPLTPEEFEIMKTHTTLGYEIFKGSDRPILQTAAIIAWEHHEKWDGSGYPRGIAGEKINILGRIAAVADVIDALSHERVYKKAWPFEKVMELIESERGKHFDPDLVDLVVKNRHEVDMIEHSELTDQFNLKK